MEFFGYWNWAQSGDTFQGSFVIGIAYSIYHKFRPWCENSFEEILKPFCWSNLVGIFISLRWIRFFAKFISTQLVQGKFLEIKKNIGIYRGGKTTKIHALVNENFQLIALELSGG